MLLKKISRVMKFITKLLLLLVFLSSFGVSYADPVVYPIDPATLYSGSLTVQINPTPIHVNDTIMIIVTATNTGTADWGQLKIYMPVPTGTQFVSFVVPDRNLQNYDPSTGIWNVVQMKHFDRGQQKTAILTVKVLPSAAGKKLRATASFRTLILEGYGINMAGQAANARADVQTVLIKGNGPGTGPGSGPGTGPGTGPGSGPGTTDNANNGTTTSLDPLINSNGDSKAISKLNNYTNSQPNPLTSQSGGGGGGGKKVYDVSLPSISKDDLPSYLIAVVLIIGMIAAGYYYGMKKED
jgi:uncharacterized repeat protein (TIGR01451 family)